jgi:exodeoxyribonuclease VII large subunit
VALLRPRIVSVDIARLRKTANEFANRLDRCYGAEIGRARAELEAHTRVLESVSYKAVLNRGFALVRGADGVLKRRAADIRSSENLTLTFADGEVGAVAKGKQAAKRDASPSPKARQRDLF